MVILCGIIGWILGSIITGLLAVKIEKCEPNNWDENWIIMFTLLWPLAMIILICEACVMYVKYIEGRKERNEKLRLQKRNEIESVLKEI